MIHDDKFGLPIVMVKMLYYIVSLLQKKQTNKQNKQTNKQKNSQEDLTERARETMQKKRKNKPQR